MKTFQLVRFNLSFCQQVYGEYELSLFIKNPNFALFYAKKAQHGTYYCVQVDGHRPNSLGRAGSEKKS